MTASVAPGQPEKAARRWGVGSPVAGRGFEEMPGSVSDFVHGVGRDGEDGYAAAAAVGDDERAHVGRDAGEAGRSPVPATATSRRRSRSITRDGVGAAVGDVGAMADGVDVDGVGQLVDWDGGDDCVGLGVDDGDGAVAGGRSGVDDVDFVAFWVHGEACGLRADLQGAVGRR